MMKRELITISDSGKITVPSEVRMSICEIAELFGVYYQSTKRIVRTIEKSSIADGDYSMSCTVERLKVYPEYYGLDMVVAVAFRVQSPKAEIFRQWLIMRATQNSTHSVLTLLTQSTMLN